MRTRELRHLSAALARPGLTKRPELTWRDHAVMLLHIASAIEHALMVQYLFAAYSLGGDQVPERHRAMVERWRRDILAVAKEEMGHLLTVQNVLALLGGPIRLDREDYPWDSPFYPAPFTLAPLSRETLAIYVFAEMPEVWDDPIRDEIVRLARQEAQVLGGSAHGSVNRVGVVYHNLIAILADHRLVPDADFQPDSAAAQASWDEWGRGYRGGARGADVIVDVVATRDEALDALHRISSQGEAPNATKAALALHAADGAPPAAALRLEQRLRWREKKADEEAQAGGEGPPPSHFARFLNIYREFPREEGPGSWQPALPVAVNPATTAQERCTTIADPASARWANLFNLRYRMLLAYLTHGLLIARQQPDGEAPSVRGAVMHRVFAEMYNLKTIAGILVRRPAGRDPEGLRAGPPFQMPYTLNLPATTHSRWRLHQDMNREARSLRRQLERPGQRHPPSPEERGYLAAMADIDRQTDAWLDGLLGERAPPRRARA